MSAFDHRFVWSNVPASVTVTGDALVVLGLFIVFLVFRENSYTSAVIEVDKNRKLFQPDHMR